MSLSDLAAIGSFLSGVAVLASLIYLAQQIRQNAKHTRASIQQGRVVRVVDLQLRLADTELSAAWIEANGEVASPQAVRRRQFDLICSAYYVGWDDTLSQYRDGLVSEEQFARFRQQIVAMLRVSPATRDYLRRGPLAHSADRLQNFLTGLASEAEGGSFETR